MRKSFLTLCIVVLLQLARFDAYDTGIHYDMTATVLRRHKFSTEAIQIAQLQNWMADFLSQTPGVIAILKNPTLRLHLDQLDDEGYITAYFFRLVANTQATVKDIVESAATGAQDWELKALTALSLFLHSLQDFYSHTTWIERTATPFGRSGGSRCSFNSDLFQPFGSAPELDLRRRAYFVRRSTPLLVDNCPECRVLDTEEEVKSVQNPLQAASIPAGGQHKIFHVGVNELYETVDDDPFAVWGQLGTSAYDVMKIRNAKTNLRVRVRHPSIAKDLFLPLFDPANPALVAAQVAEARVVSMGKNDMPSMPYRLPDHSAENIKAPLFDNDILSVLLLGKDWALVACPECSCTDPSRQSLKEGSCDDKTEFIAWMPLFAQDGKPKLSVFQQRYALRLVELASVAKHAHAAGDMLVVRGLYKTSPKVSEDECIRQSVNLGNERRPKKGEIEPHRPTFPDDPTDTEMWALVEAPFSTAVSRTPFEITHTSRLEAGFLHSGLTIKKADEKEGNDEIVSDQEKHGSYHDGMNKDAPNYKRIPNRDGGQYLPNRENEAFVLSYLESEDAVASFIRWIEEVDPSRVQAIKKFAFRVGADEGWLAKGRRTALYASLYTSKGALSDLNGKWKGDGSGSAAYFIDEGSVLTWATVVSGGFLNSPLGQSVADVAPKLAVGLEQGPVKMPPDASRSTDGYRLGSIPHVTQSQDFWVLTIRTDWVDVGLKDANDKVFAVITVGNQIIRETDVDRKSLMRNTSSTYRLGFKWQTQVVLGPDTPNRIPVSYKLFKEVVSWGGSAYNEEMRLMQADKDKDPSVMTIGRAAKGAEENHAGIWNGFRGSFEAHNAENELLMIQPVPGKEWNFVVDRSERKIYQGYSHDQDKLSESVNLGQDIEETPLRSPGSGTSICSHDAGEGPSLARKYNWCRTEDGSWDYCVPEHMRHLTSDGRTCREPCDLHGKSYYWCKTEGSFHWDYCSPPDNFKKSRDGHTTILSAGRKTCRDSGKVVRAQVNLLVSLASICPDHSAPPSGAASLIQVTDGPDQTSVTQRKKRKGSNRIQARD